MNKIKNLSETNFLKLLFAFFSGAFVIAAFCMPDGSAAFSGLAAIITSPAKLSTNYFSVGGYSGTFLNMGLLALAMTLLFHFSGGAVNNVSTLGFLLTLGFGSWGMNILNIWFPILGVVVANLIKKDKPLSNVNAMLFSTGLSPVISEMLLRYPNSEVIGFNVLGFVLAVVVGIIAGIAISSGLGHSPNVHKGFNLYSAALPVGVTAFFLNGMLYKVMGIELPGAAGDMAVASWANTNIFCLILFGICIVMALVLGCSPRDYWKLLKNRGQVNNLSGTLGNAVFLMNLGVYGLFILTYYNLVGGKFNGVTFGLVFCMLCTCNSGSRPSNVWPIMLGYVVASTVTGFLSGLLGGSFSLAINAQAILVGLCYANGLSPVCDKYGWQYGCLAAMVHYTLVTLVPNIHGGFCLYNGGFTGIFVCILLIPVLERFCKTKEARMALKAN